ncbi:MAG: hypothetical protein AAFQ02_07250 [Bacteroidota bacterium]
MSGEHNYRNDLVTGLGLGALSPIVGALLIYLLFSLMVMNGWMDESAGGWRSKRWRTITLIGICSNIFWIRRYNHPFTDRTLRGLSFSTMIWALIWFVIYYRDLYAE